MAKHRLKVKGPVSHAGESYEPDKHGTIEVPEELAKVLIESHGAVPLPSAEDRKAGTDQGEKK